MSDVTLILQQIEAGEKQAASELLPIVYDELRTLAAARMGREPSDHTLQATSLVDEAYLRLVDPEQPQRWESRGHFFSAAAEAMRRILIESARSRKTQQRSEHLQHIERENCIDSSTADSGTLLDIDEGLKRLVQEDVESAELVKLRLFAGLSVAEAGQLLGMSRSTAYENWDFARSWFAVHLAPVPP
jgi:RNA polymerase sigma factor (TIGR02999 family)